MLTQLGALLARWRVECTLIAFAAATVSAQVVPVLPTKVVSLLVLALSIAALLALRFVRLRSAATNVLVLALLAATMAASLAWVRADLRLADELPREWEGRDIEIVGVVDELPQRNDRGIRFAFRVEQVLTEKAHVPSRIALGWYKPSIKELAGEALPEIRAGERWRWTVRLKRPHGYVNPAGFDLEAWLLERNIRAQGSIQTDSLAKRLDANAGTLSDRVERLREDIRARMQAALRDERYAGVLIALAIGDQQAISDADWSLFNATGVSHLLSISGAHVTLFASWVALAVFFVWRRSPGLIRFMPAQKAAALAAAIVACTYAVLTGFAVPAQRTCYMLVVAALALWLNRQVSPWLILLWAAVVVLLIDPWAALAVGFWFSFVAVVLLLYVTQFRVMPESAWRVALKTQAAVMLGLAPISIAFFQQVSLIGPFANAIAIPLITLLVVPLTLVWLILPIDPLLHIAHWLITQFAAGLTFLMGLTPALWSQHAPPVWTVILALAGVAWMLAPRLVPHRWIGALWCVPLFTVAPSPPEYGEFRVTVLDVGQGTAVALRTHSHTLVYDAGPRWTDETDAGARLVAPYLRASGSKQIDGLVISHLDLDHSGGANSLLRGTPVSWMLTSVFSDADIVKTANERNVPVIACNAGQRWAWDGVEFEVLHPRPESYASVKLKTNDRSCVIKASSKTASLLLTGDIESLSETALVSEQRGKLSADALLIPHHGSTTSSTAAFLDVVSPKQAFINAGYRNRFGHPRDTVLARYAERGIAVQRTDWHGAITVDSKDNFQSIRRERNERRRYWIDRVDPSDTRPIE